MTLRLQHAPWTARRPLWWALQAMLLATPRLGWPGQPPQPLGQGLALLLPPPLLLQVMPAVWVAAMAQALREQQQQQQHPLAA